jgi:hypothetical protein
LEKLNKIRMRRECFCFGGTLFFFTKNTLVKKGAPWKQELH